MKNLSNQSSPHHLELSLYDNAIDSIQHGIEHYIIDRVDARRYKYAILQLSQGVALLLKERLRQEHPSFIFTNVAEETKTVDIEAAIIRLEKIAKIDLGHARDTILELGSLRNKIEHYAINISKQQADSIIGRTIPFLVSFCRDELKKDFRHEIGDDNWQALLQIQDYRNSAIKSAESKLAQQKLVTFLCPMCQAHTAIAVPKESAPIDPWILYYRKIVCTVCSEVASIELECRECKRPISLGPQVTVPYSSYCGECQARFKAEFGDFENPTFVAEVQRWFREEPSITTEMLYQLLRNVSTAGSSKSRYVYELINKGVVDFDSEFDKERYIATKPLAGSWLEPYWSFKWTFAR
jgi:hypothetical protein